MADAGMEEPAGRTRPERVGILSPLAFRPFRWYWLGQSVSIVGDRVYMVALPFLVFHLGGDAAAVGAVFTAFSVPQLLFLLFGGVLVDRFPRRRLLLVADLLRSALLVGVLVLVVANSLMLHHVYLMAALFGLASAFFLPATFSIVPELVPRPNLPAANSLRAFSQEMAGVLGPPLGGLLVSGGGIALALGFDLATFIVGIGFLLLLPKGGRPTSHEVGSGYLVELREGFRFVFGSVWLWLTIVLFSAINVLVSGSISVVLPVLAQDRFSGAVSLGWLLSCMAAGALLASLALGQFGAGGRRGLAAYLGVAVSGFALLVVAKAGVLLFALTAMVFLGASLTVFGVVWESTVQELVPDEMLGRVISIDMLGSFALLPFGYLLLGWAVTALGVESVLTFAGGGTIALVLVGLAVPEIRRLR